MRQNVRSDVNVAFCRHKITNNRVCRVFSGIVGEQVYRIYFFVSVIVNVDGIPEFIEIFNSRILRHPCVNYVVPIFVVMDKRRKPVRNHIRTQVYKLIGGLRKRVILFAENSVVIHKSAHCACIRNRINLSVRRSTESKSFRGESAFQSFSVNACFEKFVQRFKIFRSRVIVG